MLCEFDNDMSHLLTSMNSGLPNPPKEGAIILDRHKTCCESGFKFRSHSIGGVWGGQYFQFFLVILFVFLMNKNLSAQGTTAVGMHLGLSVVDYKNVVPGGKTMYTVFLPHIHAEVKRSSENIFYGAFGIGYVPRRIAFYEFDNGEKLGVTTNELYSFVKTGFQARSNYLTHLPYVALGIGRFVGGKYMYGDGSRVSALDTVYSPKKNYQFKPYMEIGNTSINSTYTEDKRNIMLTFAFRYYPTNLFKQNFIYTPNFNDIRQANFHMFEFIITMGIQQNFHHEN